MNWFGKCALALGAWCAFSTAPALAQTEIKDNEPVKGRIDRARQKDTWTFTLDKQVDTVHLNLDCKATKVLVFLKRGNQEFVLLPDGKGDRANAIGVRGFEVSAVPDPNRNRALDKGQYTVIVQAADGNGTGNYTLRIPELAAPAKVPAAPEAPNEKLARLKKELDQVRARETELADEIKRLEAELKKRN